MALSISSPINVLVLDISQSVGVKGKNQYGDVIRVQEALNTIPASEGTSSTLLSLDGIAGPKTCDAIQKLQLKHFGWKGADGRIDPGGSTAQLMSGLLVRYGGILWTIRRLESAVALKSNLQDVRTIESKDRIFEIADVTGRRRALYHFRPAEVTYIPRAADVPALRERPEVNMFNTVLPCGPHAFATADAMYSEFSPDADHAVIQLTLRPRAAHIAPGVLSLHVNHQWIKPMSTPGARARMAGIFGFLRDDSAVGGKTPRW
jgi:hypothetical protein